MKEPGIIIPELKFNNKKLSSLENDDVEFIIVHHSGVSQDQTVQIIHNFHKNYRGWAGIGYHFYISFNGTIYRGRPLSKKGVHTKGYNHHSVGLCLAGNFNEENLMERNEQYNSLVELLIWLKSRYPNAAIAFHNDFSSTSCPGSKFPRQKIMDEVNLKTNAGSSEEHEVDESTKIEQKANVCIQRKVEGTFNGEKTDITGYIIEDRTYIPLRVLEDWFDDVEIKWDEEKGEYQINTRES